VLPFAPEPIMQADGSKKNDCEHNAAKRFLADFKREHPHLKVIILGDGLYSSGPFIKLLKEHQHSFILVAKESNHKSLFEEFNSLIRDKHEIIEKNITHKFSWCQGLPINDSHPDCLVNVLEYIEEHDNGKKNRWVWVTDIPLNKDNVYKIMKGGRARHKIENETFNTLKNQGYHFEHNFGHGNKNLATVFSYCMVIAFYVDQLSQLGCKLFKKALTRFIYKKYLWDSKRGLFFNFIINSIEDLWLGLSSHHKPVLVPDTG
jgi:hypothetical protein